MRSPAAPGGGPGAGTGTGTGPVTLARVVRSEWIKFGSLRSSWATLLAAVAAIVGFGALVCWVTVNRWDRLPVEERLRFSPAEQSLKGFFLAQLAVGVLGVLVVTGEYATGLIRTTLAAVPRRLPVLWAKAAVFGAATLVLTGAACPVAFLLGQRLLAGRGLETALSAPGVVRVVLGTALYLTVVGLLAVGVGALIRSTAGSIAAVLGLLLVVPGLAEVLPGSWRDHILPYLPSVAGQSLTTLLPVPPLLAPWTGFAVLCGYAAAALAAGAVLLRRRDA
ncbi:ABC transporter permease [Peterkaempfera bronchialis]|uniref:ABC transporter permease n=1 Tax=Peterkaempfera bronchialis TaxID=2126346 RepID=A0A345T6S5_9ACTN|nr:ABC transporter permease [Peterkaempfera bronchialis]